jgi:hypothetical protein
MMIDKKMSITIKGVEFPMAFNLNVLEAIQEKYGSLDVWQNKIQPKKGEAQIKDIKWTLVTFINEGIEIENENGEKRTLLTEKQLGRMITNVTDIAKAITKTVTDSVPEPDPNA